MQLFISDHALIRWHERVGPVNRKEIRRLVTNKLRNQLRLGLDACDRDGFQLELFPDLRAVLSIDEMGFWVVKTFRRVFPGESGESTESEEVKPWGGNL